MFGTSGSGVVGVVGLFSSAGLLGVVVDVDGVYTTFPFQSNTL